MLRNYQMNSSTLANELTNIFGNAFIDTAVRPFLICNSKYFLSKSQRLII